MAENDWTFFGDAVINHALRKPQPLAAAAKEAGTLIRQWEQLGKLKSSQPQQRFGADVGTWLVPLEARMPPDATATVGRPSIDSLNELER